LFTTIAIVGIPFLDESVQKVKQIKKLYWQRELLMNPTHSTSSGESWHDISAGQLEERRKWKRTLNE
jgi:hypothetical protein